MDKTRLSKYLEQIKTLEDLLNKVDPSSEIYQNTKEQLLELKELINEKEKIKTK